jgi:hypothetical protein
MIQVRAAVSGEVCSRMVSLIGRYILDVPMLKAEVHEALYALYKSASW